MQQSAVGREVCLYGALLGTIEGLASLVDMFTLQLALGPGIKNHAAESLKQVIKNIIL